MWFFAPLTTLPHSIFCIPLKNCLRHHHQFPHERKTINGSFEETKGRHILCKEKGLEKLCERFES